MGVGLLPLPGTGEGPRRLAWSVGLLVAALASRLLLFPDGPWEQDEALFASGVIEFNPSRHLPHPPGFPGWILIGKCFTSLGFEALTGLRIASSLASTLLFVVLAHLLSRLTRERVGLGMALAFSLSPIAWAHAPRAFTTTPALAAAALALWCWWCRDGMRAHIGGWFALAIAGTIRPQLGPELILIAGVGIWAGRASMRRLGLGIAVAVTTTVALFGWAASASGGWQRYWATTTAHFSSHTANVARDVPWDELGIVRAFLLPEVAVGLGVIALLGAALEVAKNRRRGAWLFALVGVTAWMILTRHHPAFPRYSVALVAVATPFVAIAFSRLPDRFALPGIGALTIAGGLEALRVLFSMVGEPMPPVAATRSAAQMGASAMAFSHGNFSFVRLAHLDGSLGIPIVDVQAIGDAAPLPADHVGLAGSGLRFIRGPTVCTRVFEGVPEAARSLSQHRFERTVIARNPIALGEGVHRPERDKNGVPFAWLSASGRLFVPAGADRLGLRLWTPDERRGTAIEFETGGATRRVTLFDAHTTVRLRLPDCELGCTVDFNAGATAVARPGARALSSRLLAAWPEGPSFAFAPSKWSPGIPSSLHPAGIEVEGVWGPEKFWDDQPGAWTKASMTAQFSASPGQLRIRLAKPEHAPGPVVLSTHRARREVEVEPAGTLVELPVGEEHGRGFLTIESPTFVPTEVNPQSTDQRELGVILFEVEFIPDRDPCDPA